MGYDGVVCVFFPVFIGIIMGYHGIIYVRLVTTGENDGI